MPEWAAQRKQGDLFSTGLWFAHFAAAGVSAGTTLHFIQTQSSATDERLALALKTARGETAPFCRLLESLSNYYSCGYGPIADASPSTAALGELADELATVARAFDGVRLGPLDKDSEFSTTCEARLRAAGLQTYWALAFRNWFATTEGLSFEQYLQRVPSTFPQTSEKRRQAFLRKGSGTIVITSSEHGLEPELQAYTSVYESSWKVPEPFPQFVPGLIRLAAHHGWLRLGVLRVGGEPAAAQLWFVVDGRALIYKVAYAERFDKLSVGSILTAALLDHVISNDRVREVDFLSGDDPYKAKWMLSRRDRHTLLAFNRWRWRGTLAALREALAQRRDRFKTERS